MAKQMMYAKFSDFQKAVLLGTAVNMVYENGVKTSVPKSITCTFGCSRGMFDVVLDYRQGLFEQISKKFPSVSSIWTKRSKLLMSASVLSMESLQ